MKSPMTELIAKLASEVRSDPCFIRLEDRRAAYEGDRGLQNLIFEYNIQQRALAEEQKKDETDAEFISVIEARISALFDDIQKNENYIGYIEAKREFGEFIGEINTALAAEITGEQSCPGKGGGCEGCKGCG